MVVFCSVQGCGTKGRKCTLKIKRHRFPRDKALREKWRAFCGWPEGKIFNYETARICTLHFEPHFKQKPMIDRLLGTSPKCARNLSDDAVPTLNGPRDAVTSGVKICETSYATSSNNIPSCRKSFENINRSNAKPEGTLPAQDENKASWPDGSHGDGSIIIVADNDEASSAADFSHMPVGIEISETSSTADSSHMLVCVDNSKTSFAAGSSCIPVDVGNSQITSAADSNHMLIDKSETSFVTDSSHYILIDNIETLSAADFSRMIVCVEISETSSAADSSKTPIDVDNGEISESDHMVETLSTGDFCRTPVSVEISGTPSAADSSHTPIDADNGETSDSDHTPEDNVEKSFAANSSHNPVDVEISETSSAADSRCMPIDIDSSEALFDTDSNHMPVDNEDTPSAANSSHMPATLVSSGSEATPNISVVEETVVELSAQNKNNSSQGQYTSTSPVLRNLGNHIDRIISKNQKRLSKIRGEDYAFVTRDRWEEMQTELQFLNAKVNELEGQYKTTAFELAASETCCSKAKAENSLLKARVVYLESKLATAENDAKVKALAVSKSNDQQKEEVKKNTQHLAKKIITLDKEVICLRAENEALTKKVAEHEEVLKKYFTPGQIRRMFNSNSKKHIRWSDEDIAAAAALRKASIRGYEYLKFNLKYPLPDASTLGRWAQTQRTLEKVIEEGIDA